MFVFEPLIVRVLGAGAWGAIALGFDPGVIVILQDENGGRDAPHVEDCVVPEGRAGLAVMAMGSAARCL